MIDRKVRVVGAASKESSPHDERLSAFYGTTNLVLLGDPGAGKTCAFQSVAAVTGGTYVTTRSFLNRPANQLTGLLFIDALDEQRSGPADSTTVDRVVQRLFECRPRAVWISCRSQDWLGDTDLAAFKDYFQTTGCGYTLLALRPLDEAEQLAVLVTHGTNSNDARQFLNEAAERGLHAFTRNPRKLLLLRDVVKSGEWPAALRELYERAILLQLKEENRARTRNDADHFTGEELRFAAGAVCAARLIADVEGVALCAPGPRDSVPSYRTLTHVEPERVLAALKRSLFHATESECVDYDHRTSAEYLAAWWLGEVVRAGLPLARLIALLGIDGYPTSELRGLHAWLPIFLPQHAERFIAADPIGILEYGDPTALTSPMRLVLLEALADLARKNPWFLSVEGSPSALACLVQDDTMNALINVLADANSPRGLRTLVLDALSKATPNPAAFGILHRTFVDGTLAASDRSRALTALLAFGSHGFEAVVAALPTLQGSPRTILQLRGEAVERLYGQSLGAEDLLALFRDMLNASDTQLSGSTAWVWGACDAVTTGDLVSILDRLHDSVPPSEASERRTEQWDLATFVNRAVARIISEQPQALSPSRALTWVDLRQRLKRLGTASGDTTLVDSLKRIDGLSVAVFQAFVDGLGSRTDLRRSLRRFERTVRLLTTNDEITAWCVSRLRNEDDSVRRQFLFELVLPHCWSGTPGSGELFENLYRLATGDSALGPLVERSFVCDLSWWTPEHAQRKAASDRESNERLEKIRSAFTTSREAVRQGRAREHLGFAAEVYFGRHLDMDLSGVEPRDRLAAHLGVDNSVAVTDGFRALIESSAIPTKDELLELLPNGEYYRWWRALVAGMDVTWREGADLKAMRLELVSAVVTIDIFLGVTDGRGVGAVSLHDALIQAHPELAARAYVDALEVDLQRGKEQVSGLYRFLTNDAFRHSRSTTVLSVLHRYSRVPSDALKHMLYVVIYESEHGGALFERARAALADDGVDEQCAQLWRAAAFMLRAEAMQNDLYLALERQPRGVWAIRDLCGYGRGDDRRKWPFAASELKTLIAVLGRLWPSVRPPQSWGGNTNSWDASEFVQALIAQLGAITSGDATQSLTELIAEPSLATYHNYLKSILAQHHVARREAEFDRPNWASTLATLANAAPANAADLHALVEDQLRDLAREIDGSNLDLYKHFWNEDENGRPISPKPEESCRDVCLSFVRRRVSPLGLTAEPEVHMSADKRVDIAIARPGLKTVVEVKLSHSKDLWSAMSGQLDHLYTRDPETKGFGILVVVWFGRTGAKRVTRNPVSRGAPSTAVALEQQLLEAIPDSARTRLTAVVIDVTGVR